MSLIFLYQSVFYATKYTQMSLWCMCMVPKDCVLICTLVQSNYLCYVQGQCSMLYFL